MQRYVHSENVILREIHSVYYLIDIKCNYNSYSHTLPTLNEVGVAIWNAIASPATIEDIMKVLKETFDVSEVSDDEVEKDINEYISLLNKMGYVSYV